MTRAELAQWPADLRFRRWPLQPGAAQPGPVRLPAISRKARIPPRVDLNSGSNFRRAQFGFAGTAWRDWSYNFTYDFGGNGVEKTGYIYYAYIEYDGLKPFGIPRRRLSRRSAGIEDSTGSGDLLFLERAASVDIARNIAGSPGRDGVELFAQGDNYLRLASPIPARRRPTPPPSMSSRPWSAAPPGSPSAQPT